MLCVLGIRHRPPRRQGTICFLTGAEGKYGEQGKKADKWETEPFLGSGETSLRGRAGAFGE